MKNYLIIIFLFIAFGAVGQTYDPTPEKGSGILYFNGVPSFVPNTSNGAYESEFGWDLLNNEMWFYHRDSSEWSRMSGIIKGYGVPDTSVFNGNERTYLNMESGLLYFYTDSGDWTMLENEKENSIIIDTSFATDRVTTVSHNGTSYIVWDTLSTNCPVGYAVGDTIYFSGVIDNDFSYTDGVKYSLGGANYSSTPATTVTMLAMNVMDNKIRLVPPQCFTDVDIATVTDSLYLTQYNTSGGDTISVTFRQRSVDGNTDDVTITFPAAGDATNFRQMSISSEVNQTSVKEYIEANYSANQRTGFYQYWGEEIVITQDREVVPDYPKNGYQAPSYNGFPSMNRAPDGSLLIGYAAGINHNANTVPAVVKSEDNGKTWSEPVFLETRIPGATSSDEGRIMRPSVMSVLGDTVVAHYRANIANTVGDTITNIYYQYSVDNGDTWSGRNRIDVSGTYAAYVASQGKIIETDDPTNKYIMPVYGLQHVDSTNWDAGFLINNYLGETGWTFVDLPAAGGAGGYISEVQLIYMPDSSLIAFGRNETNNGVYKSVSTDFGATWTTPTKVVSTTQTKPDVVRLRDGRMLLTQRNNPNTAAILLVSDDDGDSWTQTHEFSIDKPLMYGSMLVANNKQVFLAYGREHDVPAFNGNRSGIQLAVIDVATAHSYYYNEDTDNLVVMSSGGGSVNVMDSHQKWKWVGENLINQNEGFVSIKIDEPTAQLSVGGDIAMQNERSVVRSVQHGGRATSYVSSGGRGQGPPMFSTIQPDTLQHVISSLQDFGGICYDGRYHWFAPMGNRALRFDPITKEQVEYILPVSAFHYGCVYAGEYVWFIPSSGTTLARIHTRTFATSTVTLPDAVFWSGVFDGQKLWLAPHNADDFVGIDVETDSITTVTSPISGNGKYNGSCTDGKYLYFVGYNSSKLTRLDPSDTTTTTILLPPGSCSGIIYDGVYLWVSHYATDDLFRINPVDFEITSYDLPISGIVDLAFDGTSIWGVSRTSTSIVKVDPITLEMVEITTAATGTNKFFGVSWNGQSVVCAPEDNTFILEVFPPEYGVPNRSMEVFYVNLTHTIDTDTVQIGDGVHGFVVPPQLDGAIIEAISFRTESDVSTANLSVGMNRTRIDGTGTNSYATTITNGENYTTFTGSLELEEGDKIRPQVTPSNTGVALGLTATFKIVKYYY